MEKYTPVEVAVYYECRFPKINQRGMEWRGPCPIHKGAGPNFAVNPQTGAWYCHSKCDRGGDIIALEEAVSGCDFKSAKAAVDRVVAREDTKPEPKKKPAPWRDVAVYGYTSEAGELLYEVIRQERTVGSVREKKFKLRRPDGGGGWIWNAVDVRRVPYRLPEVAAAQTVLVVEGEKCVEALRTAGLPEGVAASCNSEGAGKFRAEMASHFAGKQIVIIPDNDRVGREHAHAVAQHVIGIAASVRIVQLPGLAEKEDIADWLDRGCTYDQLAGLFQSTTPVDANGLAAMAERSEPHDTTPQKNQAPFPFVVSDEGVFFLKQSDGEETQPVRLAARVNVVGITRDPNGGNWGRLLEWHDREGRLHRWAMPMEALASDSALVRARLLSEGLPFLSTNARRREQFAEYLQTAPAADLVRSVSRVGWYERAYIFPDDSIGSPDGERVLYQSALEGIHHWNVKGRVDDWRDRVGRLCTGNSRLVIAVSAAFAGALLDLVSAESGGIHFHGTTSTGKSTALVVGGSVLGGGGQAGFVQTWRTTINGPEAIAAAHNDSTLFLDELAQVDPGQAGEAAAYLLGNGQGKGRMTRTIGARNRLTWTLMYVSAGEQTLSEHVAEVGKKARGGAEIRLLNIRADAGAGMGLFEELHGHASADAFSRALKEAAQNIYGAPFRAFLSALVPKRDEVAAEVRRAMSAFQYFVPGGASGEVRRAAHRFALIGAAGELATEWGLTGWPEGEALKAAGRCFSEWLGSRGTAGSSDLESGVQRVREFLERHGSARFQPIGDEGTFVIRDRAGFRRKNSQTGETEYLILQGIFRSEVCAGYDHTAVAKELDARGFLVREGPHLTIKPRLPEIGLARVYCVRAEILGNERTPRVIQDAGDGWGQWGQPSKAASQSVPTPVTSGDQLGTRRSTENAQLSPVSPVVPTAEPGGRNE